MDSTQAATAAVSAAEKAAVLATEPQPIELTWARGQRLARVESDMRRAAGAGAAATEERMAAVIACLYGALRRTCEQLDALTLPADPPFERGYVREVRSMPLGDCTGAETRVPVCFQVETDGEWWAELWCLNGLWLRCADTLPESICEDWGARAERQAQAEAQTRRDDRAIEDYIDAAEVLW